MIAFALVVALATQDTNAIPPRVRAMLDHFPPPKPGNPSIAIGFSRDTVWIGEQVELVTATWFPRPLRGIASGINLPFADRRSAGCGARAISSCPSRRRTRIVGRQVYDLYVSCGRRSSRWAPESRGAAAMLTYGVPTSTAYFAPEERKDRHIGPGGTGRTRHSGTARGPVGHGPGLRAERPPRLAQPGGNPPGRVARDRRTGSLAGEGQSHALAGAADHAGRANCASIPRPPTSIHAGARLASPAKKRFRFTVVTDSAGVADVARGAISVLRSGIGGPVQDRDWRAPSRSQSCRRTAIAGPHGVLTVTGEADVPFDPVGWLVVAGAALAHWWPQRSCRWSLMAARRRRRRAGRYGQAFADAGS